MGKLTLILSLALCTEALATELPHLLVCAGVPNPIGTIFIEPDHSGANAEVRSVGYRPTLSSPTTYYDSMVTKVGEDFVLTSEKVEDTQICLTLRKNQRYFDGTFTLRKGEVIETDTIRCAQPE